MTNHLLFLLTLSGKMDGDPRQWCVLSPGSTNLQQALGCLIWQQGVIGTLTVKLRAC